MMPTCPVPTSNANAGFTLIEVIVAVAITVMTVAAASSAILTASRLADAASFYHVALQQGEWRLAAECGYLAIEDIPDMLTASREEERITSDADGQKPIWKLVVIRSKSSGRHVTFAFHHITP